jgi:hypothetical protein
MISEVRMGLRVVSRQYTGFPGNSFCCKKRQRVLQDGEEEAEERPQRKQYIVIRCMSMTPVAINICHTARTPLGMKLDLLQFTERGLEARGRLLYNH